MRSCWPLAFALVACGPLAGTETGNPNPRPVSMVTGTDLGMPTGVWMPPTTGAGGSVDVGVPDTGVAGGSSTGSVVEVPEPVGGSNVGELGMGSGGMTDVGVPSSDHMSPGGAPSTVGSGVGATHPSEPGSASPPCMDSECAALAQTTLAGLAEPGLAPEPCTSAICSMGACTCSSDAGASIVLEEGGDCILRGRARGCLIDTTEYQACSSAELDSCDVSCSLAYERLNADANTTFMAEVVTATCEQDICRYEVKIDGRCYTDATSVEAPCSDGATSAP